MYGILDSIDSDEQTQIMILEQFIAEAALALDSHRYSQEDSYMLI